MVDWGDVLKTLGSTAVIVAALAFVAQSGIKLFLDRDIEAYKAKLKSDSDAVLLAQKSQFDRQLEAFKTELKENTDRRDRIRDQVTKWSNPILGSVEALKARLDNILLDDGYLALSASSQGNITPEWSITYDYFFPTTVYLFADYFCWVRFFEENMSFELFTTHPQKDAFLKKIRDVELTLRADPKTS
jgi:hypothetical protein